MSMSKTTTFKDYWAGVKLPLMLHRLRQPEFDAVAQIAKLAFLAGKRAGKRETT